MAEDRQVTIRDVIVGLFPEEEDQSVRAHFKGCGWSPKEINNLVQKVERRQSRGDKWAWCTAVVTVTDPVTGRSADQALGACCLYEGAKGFMESGYYDDMIKEALDTLNRDLRNFYEKKREAPERPTYKLIERGVTPEMIEAMPELLVQTAKLIESFKTGTCYDTKNPYSRPEVKDTLILLQRLCGLSDYLDVPTDVLAGKRKGEEN